MEKSEPPLFQWENYFFFFFNKTQVTSNTVQVFNVELAEFPQTYTNM